MDSARPRPPPRSAIRPAKGLCQARFVASTFEGSKTIERRARRGAPASTGKKILSNRGVREAATGLGHMRRPTKKIACFHASGDPVASAAAIAADSADSALTVLFASAAHDLAAIGRELAARGVNRVIGAATGRIISARGFETTGLTGFHLPAGRFASADLVLEDVAGMGLPELRASVRELRRQLAGGAGASLPHRFALLFVDAESRCEERLAAVLGMELNGVPLIGGSAGDLYFNPLGHPPGSASLLHRNSPRRGAAILSLVASATPGVAYCHNHYLHSDKKFVI